MRSAIVLLERSSVIPKYAWRDSSYRRTLMPIEVTRLIRSAWKSNQIEAAEQGSIAVSLTPDGSAKDTQAVHSIQGHQKDFIGVFEVSFISPRPSEGNAKGGRVRAPCRIAKAPHPPDRSASAMETHSCSAQRAIRQLLWPILPFAGISSGALHRPHARPIRTNAIR